jgi:hypothetical protein
MSDNTSSTNANTCPAHPDAPNVHVPGPAGGVVPMCRECASDVSPEAYPQPGDEHFAYSDAM